jgi:DNA mismatch repair protein MutL
VFGSGGSIITKKIFYGIDERLQTYAIPRHLGKTVTRIKLLADDIVNKIAAGEVVERPASVIKELVENSIDAGASAIKIELEKGGTSRISVIDNGGGIPANEIELAVKRHATSKIAIVGDLFQVATMGFRGEALAAIAAVSRLRLQSREATSESGAEVVSEGPECSPVKPWNGAVGTAIHVEHLFFNVPARRAFLKSEAVELSHCVELVEALCLAHPEITFSLWHNGKERLASSGVQAAKAGVFFGEAALRARAQDILGKDQVAALIYLTKASKYGKIEALISTPGHERTNGKEMYGFVNGRMVKDKVLRYGILRGYHSHLLRGRYPTTIIYITMDPSLVDVNVHPAKTEVRFQYASEVQGFLAMAIRESLRSGAWASPDVVRPENREASFSFVPPPSPRREFSLSGFSGGTALKPSFPNKASEFSIYRPQGSSVVSHEPPLPEPVLAERGIPWGELHFLGAFAKCYLFFELEDKLLVLDQHAFHERVLYERLCKDPQLIGSKQPLLVPETLELTPSHLALLMEKAQQLSKLGFSYEKIDDEHIEIKAIPALLMRRDPQELFEALASDLNTGEEVSSVAGIGQNILATFACHAAVKAGEELEESELKRLLSEAYTVDFFHNCPHGRRVFRWWDVSHIARWFDR